jgi:predicted  nucleic acid-binding Zn-ribbon protein
MLAKLATLLCLLFAADAISALRYPRQRNTFKDSSYTSRGNVADPNDIDAILAELNAQARTQASDTKFRASEVPVEGGEVPAEAEGTDPSASTDTEAVVDSGEPTEVTPTAEEQVATPEGSEVPTIEASEPTVPEMPVIPPEPKFPALADRLGGPAVRAQANVPEGEASPDDMSIEEQEEQAKLDEAIGALNEDLMHYVKQIGDETKWVLDVRKVVTTYDEKAHRVETNINHLRTEIQGLYKKKKQIENLKMQKQLELKLKAATSDLSTLEKAMAHVRSKQDEFKKSKSEVLGTIGTLEDQLAGLKGKHKPSMEKMKETEKAIEDQQVEQDELAADTDSDDGGD